jgi:7-cyano-7-deazaguanine synthase
LNNGKCLVLLSGGIDSSTALWWSIGKFEEIYAITFLYAQRHEIEVEYAKILARKAGVKEHIVFDLSHFFRQIGSSSLIDESLEVPKGPYPERGIISTYVPMRNSIFGVIAGAVTEKLEIENLVFGVHASDVPNYPDTRPEWASALEALLNSGSSLPFERSIRIRVLTPLINLKKHQIIELGLKLGVPFEYTWSCYSPKDEKPCGECPACIQRRESFEKLGIKDPLIERLEKKEVKDDRETFA